MLVLAPLDERLSREEEEAAAAAATAADMSDGGDLDGGSRTGAPKEPGGAGGNGVAGPRDRVNSSGFGVGGVDGSTGVTTTSTTATSLAMRRPRGSVYKGRRGSIGWMPGTPPAASVAPAPPGSPAGGSPGGGGSGGGGGGAPADAATAQGAAAPAAYTGRRRSTLGARIIVYDLGTGAPAREVHVAR